MLHLVVQNLHFDQNDQLLESTFQLMHNSERKQANQQEIIKKKHVYVRYHYVTTCFHCNSKPHNIDHLHA